MDYKGLMWCKKQKKGIRLIEPNDNLAYEYQQTAEETLEILKSIKMKLTKDKINKIRKEL
ncbi:hypothetical protein HZA96_06440 [Candidatus Woesearchaeota archaeon]|nr:hypothetical protein [Candidatus Woesearchaeota archaeon]